MERSALPGKRRQDAPQPSSKPPIRLAREKSTKRPVSSGRIKLAKDSSEFIRVPRKAEARDLAGGEEGARHFVANISSNGALELKPSRIQPPNFTRPPATPPKTADGKDGMKNALSGQRESHMSGTWTPPPQPIRGATYDHRIPMPPLSMANTHQRRRTRSASFFTVNTARRETFDSVDFQLLLNGHDPAGRPKSSVDIGSGLIDMRIPNYRLGTPRFSDRGTAYLHNSMYTMTSTNDELRSSVHSRAEFDRLFPAPPGRERGQGGWLPRTSSPYLHPATAASLTPPRLSPSPTNLTTPATIAPALYDKVSANLNDHSQVRYSPSTGRIVAATTGRLIIQITSPLFLDYELLADFFLTFRTFMSTYECLDYLMARMQWALGNDNDAGRIVRVRTFVALRHWILNYFSDDFVGDFSLRQRLCRSVNDLARALLQRQDRGGSDINVIGELKKCWRRTCAMFWPVADGLETSPDMEISPGEEQPPSQFGNSSTSLPLSVRHNGSRLDFRRSSLIQILVPPENVLSEKALESSKPMTGPDYTHTRTRTASIPTSPMSEQSLEVLSCSIPFLRYVKPMKAIAGAPRPQGPQRNPPLSGSSRAVNHAHHRSGSFSDALRDKRPPLPSGRPQSVDLSSLRSYTFTGGLVRGLLLQPSPSKVDLLIPLSPSLSVQDAKVHGRGDIKEDTKGDALEGTYFQDHYQQNAGAKKIVRDVRRALSSRKDRHESPASSHRSTNSSDSRLSGPLPLGEKQGGPSAWQQLRGPPRSDMLGERLEASYREVFEDTFESTADPEATEVATQHVDSVYESKNLGEPTRDPAFNRMNSHITTGSRSIVIVDDTGMPEMPQIGRALPSVSTWDGMAVDPLFYERPHTDNIQLSDHHSLSTKADTRGSGERKVSDSAIHDLLNPLPPAPQSDSLQTGSTSVSQARKSSSVHPSGLDMPPIRNQLRRRPGGDLKAADHVHDLEPEPRPYTDGSLSTVPYSNTHSGVTSSELSGTHFSGQAVSAFRFPMPGNRDIKNESLGLLRSQPDVRPSMERQMSQLAKLPDEHPDGGVENALAKLEGKTSSPAMLESQTTKRDAESDLPSLERQKPRSQPLRLSDAPRHQRQSSAVAENFILSPQTDRQGASIYSPSDSDALSEFDPSSLRGSEVADARQPRFDPTQMMARKDTEQSASTMIIMDKESEAENAIARPENKADTAPNSAASQGSFLLDDNESLSDISTEIADQSGDDSFGVRSFFFDDTVDDEPSGIPTFNPPPTPPSTVGAPRGQSPEMRFMPIGISTHNQRALKEAASAPKVLSSNRADSSFQVPQKELRRAATQPAGTMKAHLPFVLAFESDVIAEQLTIIEKDAIDEVDWKDLITLNWQQNPAHARNWVQFLQRGEANGIDIVIARFNLVVKWVVSECVLTDSASERAKCITKYIHIAAHAHRLRNYASTYQITLALLSADLARLPKTWALVPAPEKQTLARFEKLCQPVRNFQTLRTEMEAITAEASCIPFIGLYTHDLMFNAQKPARIEPTPPSKEPLVNFERFQTAATIVKSLLRLIETSSNYIFHPHPEVLSRCLWLAALEDGEIAERCKGLD